MERIALEVPLRIGVVANTHGPAPEVVLRRLVGCDLIVHAGDIGTVATLEALGRIARVVAVRGNSDRLPPLRDLPESVEVVVGGVRIVVVHNHGALPPQDQPADLLVSGLWHHPSITEWHGQRLVSPGSASPAWPEMPVSLALLLVTPQGLESAIVRLEAPPSPPVPDAR